MYTLKNVVVSLAGQCLYLDNKSTIEYHECNTLYDGCPERNYQSFELYKCKQTYFTIHFCANIYIMSSMLIMRVNACVFV